MTAERCAFHHQRQVACILLLLTGCAGLACPAVSIDSAQQVERQAAASEDPGKALEGGPWLLLEVKDVIVQLPAGERQPYLMFVRQDRRVTGYSGCNEFTGGYDQRGDALTFGLLAMTRRYCAGAAGETERVFVEVLSKVRSWRIEGRILLFSAGNKVLARFRQERQKNPLH
jgi:heat shock protein HslJ